MYNELSGQERIELLGFYDRLLKMKPVFDRLFAIAESKLLQAAESGYDIPSHKVTKGRGSRVWNADRAALEMAFGDAILGERELLSPAAAEKKLGKADVANYIRKVEGGVQLAPRSSILDEVSINCNEFT